MASWQIQGDCETANPCYRVTAGEEWAINWLLRGLDAYDEGGIHRARLPAWCQLKDCRLIGILLDANRKSSSVNGQPSSSAFSLRRLSGFRFRFQFRLNISVSCQSEKKDRNLFTCIVKIESFLFLSLEDVRRWSRFHSWKKKILRRRRSCFEIRFRCYVRRKLLQNIFFLFSFVDYAPTVWKKKKKWRVKT